jgi:hypothetical protein
MNHNIFDCALVLSHDEIKLVCIWEMRTCQRRDEGSPQSIRFKTENGDMMWSDMF